MTRSDLWLGEEGDLAIALQGFVAAWVILLPKGGVRR
jgi:hypothetical protein